MSLTVEYEYVTHERLGMALGQYMGMFYEDDSTIRSSDTEWIQGDINIIIGLFRRVGIMPNVAESKTMTCQPGSINTGISYEDLSIRSKG